MFFNRKKKQQQPAKGNATRASSEPSFIGRNCIFEGQITCDGELHIDGTIRGSVEARLCVIDTAGLVQGTVTGDLVHVRGRVLGPIQGINVFIHAGAHVEGDVFNDTISIENGAFVYGSIKHNSVNSGPKPLAPLNGSSSKALSLTKRDDFDLLPGQPNLRAIDGRKTN
jgi:cytoskeletal protein CcmA (bactofilin family)